MGEVISELNLSLFKSGLNFFDWFALRLGDVFPGEEDEEGEEDGKDQEGELVDRVLEEKGII